MVSATGPFLSTHHRSQITDRQIIKPINRFWILWFLRSAEPGGGALALLLIIRLFDINPLFYLKSVLMKRVYPLLFTVVSLTVMHPVITEAQCTCTGGVPATPVDY